MTLHAANHIDRMPLARHAAIRRRVVLHPPSDCTHRAGFTNPMRVPRTGRDALVATCIDCGRAYYVLHDGAVARTLEGVKVTRYRRDGGSRADQGHGGPDSSVVRIPNDEGS